MSKIGNLYIELTEQANELGFETVEEAFNYGYEVVRGELKPKEDQQTKAHEAWLKEKEIALSKLDEVLGFFKRISNCNEVSKELKKESNMNIGRIRRAMNFIKKGEI